MTKKIYLAHSISTKGEFNDSKRVAQELRKLGYHVYVASENISINDKKNNPTPIDIYNADVNRILECDIFVVNLNGNLQDGTISEIGVVAGLNEAREIKIPLVAFTSNARMLQPQLYKGISSASANHLVLGMIDKWGEFVGSEEAMLSTLEGMK